ncbi:MAG: ribonuclease H-like domain-containing protein [Planctomycetota bacterium]
MRWSRLRQRLDEIRTRDRTEEREGSDVPPERSNDERCSVTDTAAEAAERADSVDALRCGSQVGAGAARTETDPEIAPDRNSLTPSPTTQRSRTPRLGRGRRVRRPRRAAQSELHSAGVNGAGVNGAGVNGAEVDGAEVDGAEVDGAGANGEGSGRTQGDDTGAVIHSRDLQSRRDEVSIRLRIADNIDPATAEPDHFAPGFGTDVSSGASLRREECLYFDLETLGLGRTSMVFLCGSLYWESGQLQLVQDVAGDVAEERCVLRSFLDLVAERPRLVTYNGKAYDVPLLRNRLRHHGLPDLPPAVEVVDLLHDVRRRFKESLSDCRLATIEVELLEKSRRGRDIPGAEAPLRFRDYMDTGDRAHLDPVLYHNRIDLTTLVALQARVAATPIPGAEADAPDELAG